MRVTGRRSSGPAPLHSLMSAQRSSATSLCTSSAAILPRYEPRYRGRRRQRRRRPTAHFFGGSLAPSPADLPKAFLFFSRLCHTLRNAPPKDLLHAGKPPWPPARPHPHPPPRRALRKCRSGATRALSGQRRRTGLGVFFTPLSLSLVLPSYTHTHTHNPHALSPALLSRPQCPSLSLSLSLSSSLSLCPQPRFPRRSSPRSRRRR